MRQRAIIKRLVRRDATRLARFLQRRRLMFVEVAAYASGDRVISTHDEIDGATVGNREYNALLRDIVRVVNGARVK